MTWVTSIKLEPSQKWKIAAMWKHYLVCEARPFHQDVLGPLASRVTEPGTLFIPSAIALKYTHTSVGRWIAGARIQLKFTHGKCTTGFNNTAGIVLLSYIYSFVAALFFVFFIYINVAGQFLFSTVLFFFCLYVLVSSGQSPPLGVCYVLTISVFSLCVWCFNVLVCYVLFDCTAKYTANNIHSSAEKIAWNINEICLILTPQKELFLVVIHWIPEGEVKHPLWSVRGWRVFGDSNCGQVCVCSSSSWRHSCLDSLVYV